MLLVFIIIYFIVFSNSAAIVTILIASEVPSAWWVDPVGAILISLAIIYRQVLQSF